MHGVQLTARAGDVVAPAMAFTAMLDPKTEPILDAATRFLWSEDMNESREAFIANHVSLFAGADGPEGEQRLEWTQAHR